MANEDERIPLIEAPQFYSKKDNYANLSIILGLVLFVGLTGSVVIRIPFSAFTFHPVFMMLFIVLMTEGIVNLQLTTTATEKKVGLKYHAWIQSGSYLSAIVGVSFIFYNKVISNKPHFESVHGKLGLFVFIYLFVQVVFGVTIGLMPITIYGSLDKAKKLWKYHRTLGYILLLLVWVTAQLGVRADYMYSNLYNPYLIHLHWLSLALVLVGLFYRTRVSKLGKIVFTHY
ncbi:unnamed protein product [Rhizopus stolonifer]